MRSDHFAGHQNQHKRLDEAKLLSSSTNQMDIATLVCDTSSSSRKTRPSCAKLTSFSQQQQQNQLNQHMKSPLPITMSSQPDERNPLFARRCNKMIPQLSGSKSKQMQRQINDSIRCFGASNSKTGDHHDGDDDDHHHNDESQVSAKLAAKACQYEQQQQNRFNKSHEIPQQIKSSATSRISSLFTSPSSNHQTTQSRDTSRAYARRSLAASSTAKTSLLAPTFRSPFNLAFLMVGVLLLASSALSAPEVQQQPLQKQQAEPRSDQSEAKLKELEQQKSIVASLSSAVASAAAAAAVAAAQNTLSGSDGRSVLGAAAQSAAASVANHHHGQQHGARSNVALNGLASKFADAIPEVPYNILHNMKKLDHAAPFYNVPHKFNGVATKESGSPTSLLVSALSGLGSASGSSSFTGAAEQLSALFRSPLWKRISDGYGEFTSEFRSLFRAHQPTPMKGPTSSAAAKLLRDISVPALLMLVASSIPSDWRPGRTRRKQSSPASLLLNAQLPPSDMSPLVPQSIDPIVMSASGSDFSIQNAAGSTGGQQFMHYTPQITGPQANGQQAFNFEPQLNSINGQQLQQQQQQQQQQQVAPQMAPQAQHQFEAQQPRVSQSVAPSQQQQQQQQVATRRSGDNLAQQVDRSHRIHSLASSLTSAAAASVATGKLLNKMIMNANGGQDHQQQQQVVSPAAAGPSKLMSLAKFVSLPVDRSDQVAVSPLSDKHRYSLVGGDSPADAQTGGSGGSQPANGAKLSGHSKVLSAMTQAIGGLLSRNGASSAAEKHSSAPESGYLFDHKSMTINQGDKLMRRQQPNSANSTPEQRDLSQLVPASWKEVVKRTVNNVQQQANSQWKSIEGQLTNWVQDRLKSLPGASSAASGSQAGSSLGSSASGQQPQAAPVSNLIASVSSSAMNMLGLGNRSTSQSQPTTGGSASSASNKESQSSPSRGGGGGQTSGASTGSVQAAVVGGAKAALVGMADVIINTLTNRNTNTTTNAISGKPASADHSAGSSSSSSAAANSSPSAYPTQQSANHQSDAPSKSSGQQ